MTTRDEAKRQRLRARYAACVAMDLSEESARIAVELSITAAEQDAHLRARQHALDEWEPDQFDEFASLPPGRFDPRVFQQSTWWVDILRRPHRIADPNDLTDDHLLAVVRFILREAWRWAEFPDLRGDDMVNVEWFYAEAARRIQRTPLFEALMNEATKRGLTEPHAR